MTTTENARPSRLENHSASEIGNGSVQFFGNPPCSAGEDLFRIAKRINQNLEDSYDRLRNNNTRISSRLWVCLVSDHFALIDDQESDLSDVTEDLQALALKDLTII